MKASAFPKAYALGHRDIKDIFLDPVEITEKVDGSQFGFGKINGELIVRSKGTLILPSMVDKLFKPAVDYVLTIQEIIPDNTMFYAETLSKPKHNTIKYDRVPLNNIALFGVKTTTGFCNSYHVLTSFAENLDIDVVPLIYFGKADPDMVIDLLNLMSFLGGAKIEGVVVKNYNANFQSMLTGKFVSEEFKEVHQRQGRVKGTKSQKWEAFKDSFRTEARWNKAVQHLKEHGDLRWSPKDIGSLMREVHNDIWEEELDLITEWLLKHFGKELKGHAVYGLPEWYKKQLLMGDFNE